SVINELAAALHVHPNDLIERPYPTAADHVQVQQSASAILRELRRYDLPPRFEGEPRPSPALWGRMADLHVLRDNAANTQILTELPDLLREARALAEATGGREREEAFAVYSIGCKFAHTAAHA